jgi:hypothetical protein
MQERHLNLGISELIAQISIRVFSMLCVVCCYATGRFIPTAQSRQGFRFFWHIYKNPKKRKGQTLKANPEDHNLALYFPSVCAGWG